VMTQISSLSVNRK